MRRPSASAPGSSSGRPTRDIPFPPPPAEAFTRRGYPRRSASAARARSSREALLRPRHHRHSGLPHPRPRAQLVPHLLDRLGRRADPEQSRLANRAGELRVLRQKAVSRVDRVRARAARGVEDALHREVGRGDPSPAERLGAVGAGDVKAGGVVLREDGDRRDPHLARGPEDAHRDFAAVGDEEAADRPGAYFLPRFPLSQSAHRLYVFIWPARPLFSRTRATSARDCLRPIRAGALAIPATATAAIAAFLRA